VISAKHFEQLKAADPVEDGILMNFQTFGTNLAQPADYAIVLFRLLGNPE
jgi:hypothetical protein